VGSGVVSEGASSRKSKLWSTVIAPSTVADEVKSIKIRMDQEVRSPSSLAGERAQVVRRDFTTLAMLFAIVSEYDGEIRFRGSAKVARDRFAAAAAAMSNIDRIGIAAAFREVEARRQDLQDLLSGSDLAADSSVDAATDWAQLAERPSLMQRLETGVQERLTAWTRDADACRGNAEGIVHEGELAAAIAVAVTQPGVADSDDREYAALAAEMGAAARDVAAAVRAGEPENAQPPVARLRDSCTRCHELYR
jgi:hypothetical protein